MKKVYKVSLSLVVIISLLLSSAISSFAYSEDNTGYDTHIYFDNSAHLFQEPIYFSIWEANYSLEERQSVRKIPCTKNENDMFSVDFATNKSLRNISLTDYYNDFLISFSDKNGKEIYDLTLDVSCLGDTVCVDSSKVRSVYNPLVETYEGFWKNHNDCFGSHLAISLYSPIELLGYNRCVDESKYDVVGRWLAQNYDTFDCTVREIANTIDDLQTYNLTDLYDMCIDERPKIDKDELSELLLKIADKLDYIEQYKKLKPVYVNDNYKLPFRTNLSDRKLSFKSKNKKVATVRSDGTLKAKKPGKTRITVSICGYHINKTIIVKKPSIKITKSKTLNVSQTAKLKCKIKPKKGKVSWKSSNPSIVRVNKNGIIRAISSGTAKIKATLNYKGKKYTSTCKVVVKGSSYSSSSGSNSGTGKTYSNYGGGETVYVADTGSKYHYSWCRTLRGSKHAVSINWAIQNGYTPCKVCH